MKYVPSSKQQQQIFLPYSFAFITRSFSKWKHLKASLPFSFLPHFKDKFPQQKAKFLQLEPSGCIDNINLYQTSVWLNAKKFSRCTCESYLQRRVMTYHNISSRTRFVCSQKYFFLMNIHERCKSFIHLFSKLEYCYASIIMFENSVVMDSLSLKNSHSLRHCNIFFSKSFFPKMDSSVN